MRHLILAGLILICNSSFAQSDKRAITGIVTSLEGDAPLENAGVTDEFEKQQIRISVASESNVGLQKKSKFDFSLFGKWRGLFQLNELTEVPFIFEVAGTNINDAKVFFINGEERFETGNLRQKDDSIFIQTSPFDNELAFKINGSSLEGVLRKQDKTGRPILIKAEHADYRFATTGIKPIKNISGTYAVTFNNEKSAGEKAVGLFEQKGNHLKATFLRITGDSRYLDGIIEGNRFYLSSFIGSVPVYYTGTIADDGKLSGEIIAARGKQIFDAMPDENAALPDAYQLTLLKDGYSTLDFSFPDINGKLISLKDEKYKNKVVIIAIGGTWCPNCIDEAAFLAPWYKANRQRGIEVIAIHYERQTDTAYIRKAFSRFHQKFDIKYDEVIGGLADKQKVAASLPALNTFLSFPTTIFINKKGNISKIHTGFNGPATGNFYTQFVKEFTEEVDRLVNE